MRTLLRKVAGWTWITLALLALTLAACGEGNIELVRALPESEANAVITVLASAGIATSKVVEKNGTITIRVAASREAEALGQLRAHGLPRRNFATLGEVFKKDGIVSSPLEEQARYVYALAQELEDMLSQLDDVLYVRVLPVLPRKASLTGSEIKASAGVFIKHKPSADLSDMVPLIRELVAHSVPELEASRVSVVTAPAEDNFSIGPSAATTTDDTSRLSWLSWLSWLNVAGAILVVGGGLSFWFWRKRRSDTSSAGNETPGREHASENPARQGE